MKRLVALLFAATVWPVALAQEKPEEKKDEKPKDGNELPIKTTKTIEFATDEGTWMSLDLSPDGKTIVFELLGDLYTMPAEGGEATRIIGGIHYDGMPRYSPDGKKILFVSDRSGAENLWTINADGTEPKAVSKGRNTHWVSPSWSPDGRYVFGSKSTGYLASYKLMAFDLEGGGGMSAGSPDNSGNAGLNRMGVVCSPDGKYLYYAQRSGRWSYEAKFPMWQIYRFDREKGDTINVTGAPGSAMRPILSRDGNTMYFATRHQTGTALKARDLKSGNERWVAYPLDRDDQESRATRDTLPGMALTLDGKHMIMPLKGKIQKLDLETGKASPIPFNAKVQAEVADRVYKKYKVNNSDTVTARVVRDAAFSPDGSKSVFSAFGKIWVQEGSGKPRRLTNVDQQEFSPSWSADGSKVAFVTWSEKGGHIWTVPASGGTPTRVSPTIGFYNNPVFNPDGSRIVFSVARAEDILSFSMLQMPHTHCLLEKELQAQDKVEESGFAATDLAWVSSSGGPINRIMNSSGLGDIHFSKDPTRIYVTGAGGTLASVRYDGLDRKDILKVNGKTSNPFPTTADDIKISPDGTQAFCSVEQQLYVFSIPPMGGQTLTITPGTLSGVAPVKKISKEVGYFLNWTPDGKAVTWALGNKLYKQEVKAEKPDVTELKAELPRKRTQGTVVLKGARIVTMKGDEIIKKGDVVVVDEKIAYVGPKAPVEFKDAKVIDVSGKTIMPGMVDVHSHGGAYGSPKLPQTSDYLANLAYGVTTNRDPQSGNYNIYDMADYIEIGEAIGPRIYTTGPGVFAGIGLEDLDTTKHFIKKYKDAWDTNTLKQYVCGDRMTRQWVALACAEHGITPTTEGALDVKMGMTEIADGFTGHEHNFPIFEMYDDMIRFLAETKTYYTPTLIVTYGAPAGEGWFYTRTDVANDPKLRRFTPAPLVDALTRRKTDWYLPEEYGFSRAAQFCKQLVEAGGRVSLGSHGQLQGLGAHWELWMIGSGGMSTHDAWKCATIFGAEAIGMDEELGSIEVGKFADLIVFDKDPLAKLENSLGMKYVMKNGELFMAETMDQVWPVAKKLPPQYWQKPGPAKTVP